jgi:mono/diheme cytochrome c family protein
METSMTFTDRGGMPKNAAATWFGRVVWLGILLNLFFVAGELLTPDNTIVSVGLLPGFPTVFNRAHAVMVLSLSVLYIPAALDPLRYPAYSWLLVVSRLIAAVFWVWCVATGQGAFGSYLALDGTFFVAQLVLLQMAMPAEQRVPRIIVTGLRSSRTKVMTAYTSPRVKVATVVVVLLLAIGGWVVYDNLVRQAPEISYADITEQYKYGAIGLGTASHVPYWILAVLPDMFPEKLPGPGGYASLGMIIEPGHDVPIGFAHRRFGYDVVEANCALCHTAEYRKTPTSPPVVVPGGPSHTIDLQAFQRFLAAAAEDPRFNPKDVMAAIEKKHKFSLVEGLLYRYLIIPGSKVGFLEQKAQFAWQSSRPTHGRGRTDTFNPTKYVVFHMPDDGTIGTTDLPQVWNQRPRENMWLHWDGNNNQINQRNFAAAMAVGATPKSVLPDNFKRITDYLLDLKPPKFPFPLDDAKVARGSAVFDRACASCHAMGSKQIGQVVDIKEVGTDRYRLDSVTTPLIDRFHTFTTAPFVFTGYRKTNGYSSVPLDGIWLRGPYLHHGAVPNLRALLMPEDQRPSVFYRGYEVLDPVNVGFITEGPDAAKVGFRVDTNLPGNGNKGHTYGTDLPATDKDALLEYLKTL